ncbi:MAG: PEP-CTERM sorting domain-containing protein [Planctomycetota bacterium]
MIKSTLLSGSALLLLLATTAGANTAYDETASGDLSGDLANPTAITFIPGINTVSGSFGSNGNTGATDGSDADYLTFTLAPDQSIDAITLVEYTTTGNNADLAFVGTVAADAFTGQGGGDVDAFELFNAFDDALFAGSLPLGPGEHAFWFQQTSNGVWNYEVSFNVVPEPASLGLLALGTALLTVRRRRIGNR